MVCNSFKIMQRGFRMVSGIDRTDVYYQAFKAGIPPLPPEMAAGCAGNNIKEETRQETDGNKRKVDNIYKGDFLNHKNLR